MKGMVLVGLAVVISSCAQYDVRSAASAPSAASDGVGDSSAARSRAEERPGLATGWGDQKHSRVHFTEFRRESSKPAGTDVIYYNDSKGIDAMAGSKRRIDGLQHAVGGLVEWGVKGGWGYLDTYRERGSGRRFVKGEKGKGYTIVVKNRCRSALEVVASVDGLDVMDGKRASYVKRGYIVYPGDTLEIEGFRTSERQVAEFTFSGVANSYANLRHGETRNVGVLGLAVFTRNGVNPWGRELEDARVRTNARAFATAP